MGEGDRRWRALAQRRVGLEGKVMGPVALARPKNLEAWKVWSKGTGTNNETHWGKKETKHKKTNMSRQRLVHFQPTKTCLFFPHAKR